MTMKTKLERLGIAWRFLLGRTTECEASLLRYEAYHAGGVYPLAILSVADVIDEASDRWGASVQLEELAKAVASRVYYKFESTGDMEAAARDWALDLIADYAKQRNIVLVEKDQLEFEEEPADA